MPLGHGYTIEEQMTGEAKHGGIQVDVYPLFEASVEFSHEKNYSMDLLKTPKQLKLVEGKVINMKLKYSNSSKLLNFMLT